MPEVRDSSNAACFDVDKEKIKSRLKCFTCRKQAETHDEYFFHFILPAEVKGTIAIPGSVLQKLELTLKPKVQHKTPSVDKESQRQQELQELLGIINKI